MPVADIAKALAMRRQQPDVLLAGERNGVKIEADLTGGVAFDLGNSPREFQRQVVDSKTIVMTTTNGTRALLACAHAKLVMVSSFLNLEATANSLKTEAPVPLLLICSGTFEQAAYEDALCAGALCDLLWGDCDQDCITDSALMARKLYCQQQQDLLAGISQSRNGRRLLSSPKLSDDLRCCLQRDSVDLVATMEHDGFLRARVRT